jgi:hypothetical protein
MSPHRILAPPLGVLLGLLGLLGPLISTPPAHAQPSNTDSALTLAGTGEFAGLRVTVSQTRNLINQVVTVSWTGGKPTPPGGFSINFLQIMQCWGDDPAGPDRTQCQFGGGVAGSLPAGPWTRSRQLTYPFADPEETLQLPLGSPPGSTAYVPFWPVGRDKPVGAATSGRTDFFDSLGTNEIPLARTHEDGTGQEFFEVQTVRQAPGLGCGDPVTTGGVTTGRPCWLVVVPRGATEVDGSVRSGAPGDTGRLGSSPLSASNWAHRIVFPLEFLPVGQACPIGSPERRVVGHELMVEAISHWQPVLCAGGGALYSYTQLTDDVARNQVVDGSFPGLALLTDPLPPPQAPPDRPLVYAPVGLSGLAIAFNIEHQPSPVAPQEQLQLDGLRFTAMKLTPRLVAKLLTQSYQGAVAGYPKIIPDYLKNNPAGLTVDPEFLELNPDYAGFANFTTPPDALVQLPGSDLTSLLWRWVTADADARAFLAGTPDKHGMVINPLNKNLPLPTSTFPRNDQSCVDVVLKFDFTNPLMGKSCTLDIHPFTNDMHDSGLSASRGDGQGRTPALGVDNVTQVLKKDERQTPGQRALLAVVDTATAARYGLPTAALRNAAGQFVTPTTDSLLAGVKAMTPSPVAGVLSANPTSPDPAAYPLTALSYAVSAPTSLDQAAGADYAALLRYAAGPGQQPGVEPGHLPPGMAPLPAELAAQTRAAAATIQAQAGTTRSPPSAPPATASTSTGAGPGSLPTSTTAAANPGPTPASTAAASTAAASTAARPTTPTLPQRISEVLRRTPALAAPAVGALLVALLITGALAATSSPVLSSPALRQLSSSLLRRLRKGVGPTGR